jgi:hypothetical protein
MYGTTVMFIKKQTEYKYYLQQAGSKINNMV